MLIPHPPRQATTTFVFPRSHCSLRRESRKFELQSTANSKGQPRPLTKTVCKRTHLFEEIFCASPTPWSILATPLSSRDPTAVYDVSRANLNCNQLQIQKANHVHLLKLCANGHTYSRKYFAPLPPLGRFLCRTSPLQCSNQTDRKPVQIQIPRN